MLTNKMKTIYGMASGWTTMGDHLIQEGFSKMHRKVRKDVIRFNLDYNSLYVNSRRSINPKKIITQNMKSGISKIRTP